MCPLRLLLIFLSATLAGFFAVRNLKSRSHLPADNGGGNNSKTTAQSVVNCSFSSKSKVRSAIESGFWTTVDMASGRYLWRHLVSSSSAKRSD